MLFSFTLAHGQNKGVKTDKPVKGTSTYNAKPHPVSPVKGMKPANSVDNEKPVKGTSSYSSKPVSSPKAMKPANSVDNEKPVKGSSSYSSKPSPVVSPSKRAARTTEGSYKKEKGASSPADTRSGKSSSSYQKEKQDATDTKVAKPQGNDIEFCKGWKDGYIKGWTLSSSEPVPSIPACIGNSSCEGYKCGYKDGMKRAEIDNK